MHVLLSDIAQTFGLVLFVAAFGLILLYALSPRNRATFDEAARMALDEDDSREH
ncbi:MAG: cbb3-type cytochrome c oxidase subunit 3 [Pseudomonadota bacterium]